MRLLSLSLVALVASQAFAAPTMFPVPPGAEKADHVILQRSVAEQDYFWMNAPYPSTTALDHYEQVFSTWRPCKSSESGWVSYGDVANGASRFLHQFTRYWITPENNRAVTVLLQYESMGTSYRQHPDNDRQFVAVLHYRVPDAAAFLADLKVTCAKAPNRTVDTDARKSSARRSP
jgi:hypothetical protein